MTTHNTEDLFRTQASEAAHSIVESLEGHGSADALETFKAAAAASGNTVDDSLPHLQELLRLTVEHLALRRPGIDAGGELQRLANGDASPQDIDRLHGNALTEPIAYVLDGDWDFPATPGLAVSLYVHSNDQVDTAVVDAALHTLAAFLTENTMQPRTAPVREIIIVHPASDELRAA